MLSVSNKPIMLCVVMLSVMLSVIMLSVVMLSVAMLSVVMLSVAMLSVVTLAVVMLSVVTPSVVAPQAPALTNSMSSANPPFFRAELKLKHQPFQSNFQSRVDTKRRRKREFSFGRLTSKRPLVYIMATAQRSRLTPSVSRHL